MKKYLLIPFLFIAALATASADCGKCAEKECAKECAKECCSKEKAKCCGGKPAEGKSCCATKEEHTHEEKAKEK